MPQTETSIAQTLAAKLDVIPLDVFQQAVNAVYAYESETDEWIAEHDAMVGDDIEDEDAKDAAYDQFTPQLRDALVEEYAITEEVFKLVAEAINIPQIENLIKDPERRTILEDLISRYPP